ncbi:MAG: toll/interleukin-1 receptor domain-containing protein [Bacteroidota bacterium]|nr:toll/interleukin-1 receptor domain-containing protein [Bacteroidota bacterium]
MATNIFISYRKDDSKWNTQILYDRLSQFFPAGSLFKDFNTIKAGEDYRNSIDKALKKCNVLLVVMGKGWLGITDTDGRKRLENPEDLVRIEIATALKRNIRVIPVLFDNIGMPRQQELPEDLQPLILRQCISVSETNFDYDIRHLAEAIKNKTIENKKRVSFFPVLKYRNIIPAIVFAIIGWLVNKFTGVKSLQATYFFLLLLTPLIISLLVSTFLKARLTEALRSKFQRVAIAFVVCFFVMLMVCIYYYQRHTYVYEGFGGTGITYIKGGDYTSLGDSLRAVHTHMTDADILKKFLGGPGESARLWTDSSLASSRFYLILLFEFLIIFASAGVAILLELHYFKEKSA